MYRVFFVTLLYLIFSVSSLASEYTLKTGIVYNVEIARNEAFADTPQKININDYSEYKFDKNRYNNLQAIKKGKRKYKGNYITLFSDGDYSIKYKNNPHEYFYYDSNGILVIISIQNSTSYPVKSMRYSISGNLDSVSLAVSSTEQYIFSSKGDLKAHWIGKNCYNEQGELVLTRE